MSDIKKTYNCKACGQMYWAFLDKELKAYEDLSKENREKFDKRIKEVHNKSCYNGGEKEVGEKGK